MNSLMVTTTTTITTISVMWLMVGSAANESIFSICKCTRYQKLCRQSLTPYADVLSETPCHLASVAVNVTLNDAKNVSRYVRRLKAKLANYPKYAGALDDCAENLDGMVDQIWESLNETSLLFANKTSQEGDDFHYHVSNVQTWMSAALTDDDTCGDEIIKHLINKRPLGSYLANRISNRISRVQSLLSNALAIINTYYGN